MEIIKYDIKYKNETAKLIQDTFSEFNSTDGDEEAVKNYIRMFSTENQESLNKMFSDDLMIFLAIENNKIIGMIRGNHEKNRRKSWR